MQIDRVALLRRWPVPEAPDWADRLLTLWSGPHRGYHDLQHLSEVLERLDDLADAGTRFDARAVEVAAWFHDAVYDGQPDMELRSADLARSALLAGADHSDLADEVHRLVLTTVTHTAAPDDLNAAALIDADLAILAAPGTRYIEYVEGVRREYRHLPEATFAAGRLAVLEALAHGPLFLTEHGRAVWEPRARENLAREIAALRTTVEGSGAPGSGISAASGDADQPRAGG